MDVSRRRPSLLMVLWVSLCGCAAWGGEEVPDRFSEAEARRWAKLLGSDQYHERVEARAKLLAFGAKAVPFVEEAARNGSLEVKAMAAEILRVNVLRRVFGKKTQRAFPGMVEELAKGGDAWAKWFLEMLSEGPKAVAFGGAVGMLPKRLGTEAKVPEEELLVLARGALSRLKDNAGVAYAKKVIDSVIRKKLVAVLPEVRALLDHRDSRVRRSAVAALFKLSEKEAIPFVIEQLKDEDGGARYWAVRMLWDAKAKQAIPALIERLKDENREVRSVAATALYQFGAKQAIPSLIECLNDECSHMRCVSISALRHLRAKEAGPSLIERLEDENASVRCDAALAVGDLGVKEAIPSLIKPIGDSDALVRLFAIQSLMQLGAKEAIPLIVERLNDDHAGVCSMATEALYALGVKESVPLLLKRLGDEDASVRRSAAGALLLLRAKDAIPRLVERLGGDDIEVRHLAGATLRLLGAKEAIPLLAPLLKDDDEGIRTMAADVSAKLRAKPAVPSPIERLREKGIHDPPASALFDIGTMQAVPLLVDRLNDRVPCVGHVASAALGLLPFEFVIPEILKRIRDPHADMCEAFARVLRSWNIKKVRSYVGSNLYDKNQLVRARTVRVLGMLGSKEVIGDVVDRIADKDVRVRAEAAIALGRLGARGCVSVLRKQLADIGPEARAGAAEGLIRLDVMEGRAALSEMLKEQSSEREQLAAIQAVIDLKWRPAMKALRRLLDAKHEDVRKRARDAIDHIKDSRESKR